MIALILHYFTEFDSFGGHLRHSGWRQTYNVCRISSSTFGQNWPTLQRGISVIAELLVCYWRQEVSSMLLTVANISNVVWKVHGSRSTLDVVWQMLYHRYCKTLCSRNIHVLQYGWWCPGSHWLVLTIFSERELKFMFAICHRPSVCLSVCRMSVCNVGAPYSGDWNFWQYFYAMWYVGHPWPLYKNFMEIVPGEPLRRGS